jgi:PAS domain S-box-containing protein
VVVVNQRGEIVLLNAQSEKQFGYLRNELIGRKVKSIIPEGFAERLLPTKHAQRQRRLRSILERESNSMAFGRMEVSFPSRLC